jgi:aspartyl-tRNA(Asn)/glutamyl-tRNA(Gln) amidotransferase subunit C
MPLDKATVARIAALARIEIAPGDQERLAAELSQILGWVEQLGEVDTDGVEPLRAVMPIKPHWREDVVSDGGRQADILKNAPKSHDGYFVVPKVVE